MRLLRPSRAARTDDAALLRAVARGDQHALATLYDRHAGWLHARLTRRCADPETTAEVLQDTFVAVWRTAATHRGGEIGGWLWVIASRRLVDAVRARARADRVVHEPPAAVPSAEDDVLAGLEFGAVGVAMDRMPPALSEVLRVTVVDGMSTREAARVLGIPEGTVKTRASRARRELRALLAAWTDDSEPMGGIA